MIKTFVTLALAMGLVFSLGVETALADPPNDDPACLGQDVSGYAQDQGADFGAFVSGLATGTGGIGDEVRAHHAGLVPDAVIPNTCND